MRGSDPWSWTYRKSQKVKNLERDDHATLLIESGFEYAELKGVMLKTRAHIEHDTERVIDFAEELFGKYQGASGSPEMREALRAQAAEARRDQVRGPRDRQLGPREARRRVLSMEFPDEFDSYAVVVLRRPDGLPELPGDEEERLQERHQAHITSLVEGGEAYAGGPLLDAERTRRSWAC